MAQYKYKLEKKIIINARSEEEAQEKLGNYFFNVSFNACDFEEIQKYLFINRSCMCSPEFVKNPDYRHNINEPGTIIIT